MTEPASDGVLHGERVTLRPWSDGDAERLAAMLAHPDVAPWWPGYDEARVLREYGAPEGFVPFAIELAGEMIGVVQYDEEPDPDYRSAALDIALDADHVGQGLGPDALRTLIGFLVSERGHHRVTIDPSTGNERAIRAYEKAGFRRVGIMHAYERGPDGAWRDSLLMEWVRDDLR